MAKLFKTKVLFLCMFALFMSLPTSNADAQIQRVFGKTIRKVTNKITKKIVGKVAKPVTGKTLAPRVGAVAGKAAAATKRQSNNASYVGTFSFATSETDLDDESSLKITYYEEGVEEIRSNKTWHCSSNITYTFSMGEWVIGQIVYAYNASGSYLLNGNVITWKAAPSNVSYVCTKFTASPVNQEEATAFMQEMYRCMDEVFSYAKACYANGTNSSVIESIAKEGMWLYAVDGTRVYYSRIK